MSPPRSVLTSSKVQCFYYVAKCQFGVSSLTFLSHYISADGIRHMDARNGSWSDTKLWSTWWEEALSGISTCQERLSLAECLKWRWKQPSEPCQKDDKLADEKLLTIDSCSSWRAVGFSPSHCHQHGCGGSGITRCFLDVVYSVITALINIADTIFTKWSMLEYDVYS